jgi:hypothetical protein
MAKSTWTLNRSVQVFVLLLAVIGAGFLYLRSRNEPPDESKLIDDFYLRRATYERLRDMLLADQQVRAIYVRQGVETKESGLPHAPTEVNFPTSRYNEYRALLQGADSEQIFRAGGSNPGVCTSVWATGFGGDTRHIDTCWMEQVPGNQVAT